MTNKNTEAQMTTARELRATDYHFSQAGCFFKKMFEGNVAEIIIDENGKVISNREYAHTNTPMTAVRM